MKRPLRPLFRIAVIVALIYVSLCVILWFVQDDLVFRPRKLSKADWDSWVARAGVEEVVVDRGDVTLRGYLRLPDADGKPSPIVLYFGGNAELVTGRGGTALPPGWGFASFPYRGYGASTGSPHGPEILDDAVAIYDVLAARPDVDGTRVVTWGLSFGTGVAVHVASERPVCGVVLLAPYDRLSAIGQELYPWMPVSLLFRHEVDPASEAPDIDVPLLALHGTRDEVIPIAHGRELKSAWKGPVTWHEREGLGHDGLEGPFFWKAFAEFLGER